MENIHPFSLVETGGLSTTYINFTSTRPTKTDEIGKMAMDHGNAKNPRK